MNRVALIFVVAIFFSSLGFFIGDNFSKNKTVASSKRSVIENTLLCNELIGYKKDRYFGDEIGQLRVIYDDTKDTCLVLNIYYNGRFKDYTSMVLDMRNDETLLYYQLGDGQFVDEEHGWTRAEMIEKVREIGFVAAH
jgi:hypothetical protein